MKQDKSLSEREKMIIFNCLKTVSEHVDSNFMMVFDFKKKKFFKVKADTIFRIAEKIIGEKHG